jgi:hypothetical protein
VAKLVAGTFRMLDNAAAGLTETLAEMSPAIMVTRMRNELMMFTSRMRMAGETGAILAAREDALGRIDRSMFRLGSVVGIMGAKFLTPIYNLLADILETVERNLDVGKMVVQFVSSVFQVIGRTFMVIGNLGLGTFYGVIAAILTQIASALGIVARNTTPEYQGNEPFIQDLRLMGVPI